MIIRHAWGSTNVSPAKSHVYGSYVTPEFYVTERQTSCNSYYDDKWHCKDGFCIEIYERCDGNLDCTNGFDELDCSKLAIASNY